MNLPVQTLPGGDAVPAPRASRRRPTGPEPLIESALESFRKIGYSGSTTRDIAKGADVTVAALYHHFNSKQELLVTIMTKAMSENLQVVKAAESQWKGDPAAQLSAMTAAIVRYHTAHQAEAFVGNSELRSLEPEGYATIVAMRDEEERLFQQVVEQGIAAKVFTTAHPKLAVRAILAMATGVAAWYRADGPLDVNSIAEEYAAMSLKLAGTLPH